jgi:glycosyltransferase involved in cell wall biosynthesis
LKKLSICIPTYNRASFLETILASLTEQIYYSGRSGDVEIIVSDNCSSDNTVDILERFDGKIKFWRNSVNIGPDANFLKLFSESSGQYVWLPGDDDSVRRDSISYILRMIDIHQFDYMYLRASGVTMKEWHLRDASVVTNVELLRRVSIMTTFMTSQVIRGDLVRQNLFAATKYLGGYMAYYWIFLQSLNSSNLCLISDEREIFPDETENTGGYSFYNVWGRSVFDVFNSTQFNLDKKIFNHLRFRMFFDLLLPVTYRLRSGKAKFHFENEDPFIALNKYYGVFPYGFIMSLYQITPVFLLKALHGFMRIIAKLSKMADKSVV